MFSKPQSNLALHARILAVVVAAVAIGLLYYEYLHPRKPNAYAAITTGDLTDLKRHLRRRPGLIRSYAPRHGLPYDGMTPLVWASRIGKDGCVALLLGKGADANQSATTGLTPLMAACRSGNTAVVERLLDAGADHAAKSTAAPEPPANAAMARIVDYPAAGFTAMHEAAAYTHPAAIELLLQRGASATATDALGRTPLHEVITHAANNTAMPDGAYQRLQLEAIRLLVDEGGANVNARDADGKTPLDYVEDNDAIAEALRTRGATP